MSQIILYSGENFSGENDIITTDTEDYGTISTVKSLTVTNGIWIVYSKANYKAQGKAHIAVYTEGNYRFALKINNIRSIRKLSGTLQNHFINVYEEPNYKGEMHVIKGEDNSIVTHDVMSHQVEGGVWILFDKDNYNGKSIVSISGDHVPNECEAGLDGPVKSLKAYTIYEPTK